MGLIFTVVIFSIVQSVFGVGLLVFGTPTLLLLGHSFETTLALLLPCSMAISILQTWSGRQHLAEMRSAILCYCVPPIVVGLALVLSHLVTLDVKLLVGLALVLSACTRWSERLRRALARLLKNHARLYLMLMGFVHGVSNMGGAFLTIYVTTTDDEKERIRAKIAYGYLLFATSQIGLLAAVRPQLFGVSNLMLVSIAILTYGTAGRLVYVKSSSLAYRHMITAFMIAYGFLLIGQELL